MNNTNTIYVFGNSLLDFDNAMQYIPDLEKQFPEYKFVHVDPNENFPPEGVRDLIILDTVKGIKEPMILNLDDLADISKSPVSPHDYDLLFHLLLLKKLKKINRATIVGIPFLYTKKMTIRFVMNKILRRINQSE